MHGESLAAYKEMQRVMKFILDTQLYCLLLQPNHESEKMGLGLMLQQLLVRRS
jgi:hypothetical protein